MQVLILESYGRGDVTSDTGRYDFASSKKQMFMMVNWRHAAQEEIRPHRGRNVNGGGSVIPMYRRR